MRLSLFIAWRYLFSRKKQHAINIISAISVAGVAVGTAALVVVLSVFNGMDRLLRESTDGFAPDLVVSPAEGKYACFDPAVRHALEGVAGIASCHGVVEEKALARHGERLLPVVVKGVGEDYAAETGLEAHLLQGEFAAADTGGHRAALGYGVAAQLQARPGTEEPLVFYYPDRKRGRTSTALRTEAVVPSALFSTQQEIDAQYVITDLAFARALFGTGEELSKVEIRLADPARLAEVKREVQSRLDGRYVLRDKYELNSAFYAMMRSEKLAVFLILLFILLIASFNIVASISMLMLDKREDLATYKALGMTDRRIVAVFRTEGLLITCTGALLGMATGTALCLLQERFGLITLGDGSYIIDAYPVEWAWGDAAIITATVLAIGSLASHFPVRHLARKLVKV